MTSLAEQLREKKEDISSRKFAIVVLGSLPESYGSFPISLNGRNAEQVDWDSLLIEEYLKRKDNNDSNKVRASQISEEEEIRNTVDVPRVHESGPVNCKRPGTRGRPPCLKLFMMAAMDDRRRKYAAKKLFVLEH